MLWTAFDQRLLDARNKYAYPLVYLEALAQDPAGTYIPIPAPQPKRFLDDWESLHTERLLSHEPLQALLGLASIAYWGFYSGALNSSRSTPARALVRAAWAANGRPKSRTKHPGPAGVQAALQAAARHLAGGDISAAIRSVATLPEFGQLSFASKVLTAMSFERCGVYDRVVSEALHAGQLHDLAISANSGGVTFKKSEIYEKWCRLATTRAAEMNSHGRERGWNYHGNQQRAWRAVDVERAFFQDRDVRLLAQAGA